MEPLPGMDQATDLHTICCHSMFPGPEVLNMHDLQRVWGLSLALWVSEPLTTGAAASFRAEGLGSRV